MLDPSLPRCAFYCAQNIAGHKVSPESALIKAAKTSFNAYHPTSYLHVLGNMFLFFKKILFSDLY